MSTPRNTAVLSRGGFVIVVRHGATFPDQADTDPLNFDNNAAQRNLNDNGKALASSGPHSRRQGLHQQIQPANSLTLPHAQ
jgi:hypothetical protein